MNKTLYDEFKDYLEIKENQIKIPGINDLSPTTLAPLIYESDNELKSDFIKNINPKEDNLIEITNDLLNNLKISKSNITALKFIFYELISNIQDHSNFTKGLIMEKEYTNCTDFTFIDNGITIPQSFKNAKFPFKDECDAIIKAINGLSTKNELGYAERGTGLNNTINIVTNGSNGSVLIASGCGLLHITKYIYRETK